jgi:hypothetical protein
MAIIVNGCSLEEQTVGWAWLFERPLNARLKAWSHLYKPHETAEKTAENGVNYCSNNAKSGTARGR